MNAKDAIVEAFAQLPESADGYKNIGDVAYLAAQLMPSGMFSTASFRANVRKVREVFEQSLSCREKTLPFSFGTHLTRDWRLYRCGKHQWPGTKDLMADGLTIAGHNYKVIRLLNL